jgi:hypothetical protein
MATPLTTIMANKLQRVKQHTTEQQKKDTWIAKAKVRWPHTNRALVLLGASESAQIRKVT